MVRAGSSRPPGGCRRLVLGGDLEAVSEADTRDFAERGVRLLGRGCVDARADAPLLRVRLQRRRLFLLGEVAARLPDQLVNRRHST